MRSRKRVQPTAAEIARSKRDFWERSALLALRRATQAVLDGKAVEKRDRDFIAWRLERAYEYEWHRIKKMPTTKINAYVADHLDRELFRNVTAAIAAVSDRGLTPGAIKR